MRRRTFMKFLSLLPAVAVFNQGEAIARPPVLPAQGTWPKPAPAELIVIAGRPSVGKSTFMLNLLDRFTFEQNERSLFFSLETSREDLLHRWRGLTQYPMAFSERMKVDIYDTHRASPKNIRTVVEAAQIMNPDLRYVFIDYLQLMPWFEGGEEKADLGDAILCELKRMAVELNVAVILAAQLNREHDQTPSVSIRGVTESSPIDRLLTVRRDH